MKYILTVLLTASTLFADAMIDPFYKEVMQRGYEVLPGDSVKFPDGSVCSIEAFNAHECGEAWMNENYCIPEGGEVWDDNKCCDGLSPFLEMGVDGQATCQKVKGEEDSEDEWWFSSGTVFYFFLGVLIPLGLFVILAISVKRRLPKKE